MRISDFIKRFETKEKLNSWLRKQAKDYLYSMYMEETNYGGVGYREITRNDLKSMFLEKYYIDKNKK